MPIMSIHPTAIISPRSEIHASVEIAPYVVIDANVRIGAGSVIGLHAHLTGWTTIGENCRVHSGAVIGNEPQDVKYDGSRTFCEIGPDCVIREHVTIHRGTTPESTTRIGARCFLLAGSHVAHNCAVGDDVTLINNALLAGHVTLGDQVTFGGQAAAHQFTRIGRLVMLAGDASVSKDVPPFALTDRDGRVAGLNRVGMRRAGMSREELADVREAYRRLYGSGRCTPDAVSEGVTTDAGRIVAEFVTQPSKRGLTGRSRRGEEA